MEFAWGKVVEKFTYDFDGVPLDVTKYYANKFIDGFHKKGEYEDVYSYHSDELHASYHSMFALIIAWITYKQLGLNNHSLASGICRALEI